MPKPSRKSLSLILTVLLAGGIAALQVQCGRRESNEASDTFVTRTSALTIAIGPANKNLLYHQCATGGGGACPQGGRRYVAYGAGTNFKFAVSPASGTMSCTASAFGTTPISGAACYVSNYTRYLAQGESGTTTSRRDVAFGANGTFNFKTITGAFTCNIATFGDPLPNVTKACYVGVLDHDFAAAENSSFVVAANTPVAYGAKGHYLFQIASGTVTCATTTFGADPAPGTAKACYVMPGYVADEGAALPGSATVVRYGSGLNGNFLATPDTFGFAAPLPCDNSTFGGDPDPGAAKHCYGSPVALPELVPRSAVQKGLRQIGATLFTWEQSPLVIPAGKANCNAANGTPNGALLLSAIPGNPQVWRGDLGCIMSSPTSPTCNEVSTNGMVLYGSTNWPLVAVSGKSVLLNQSNDNRLIRLNSGPNSSRLLLLAAGRLTSDTSSTPTCRTWESVNCPPTSPPPVNCNDIFVVFKSDDCGKSWQYLSMLNSATDRPGVVFSGHDRPEFYADPWIPNRVYVTTKAGDGAGPGCTQVIKSQLFQSNDGGQTWQWKKELPIDSLPTYMTSLPSGKLYMGTCCGDDTGGNPLRMVAHVYDPVANTLTTLPMPTGFPMVEGIAPLRVDNQGRGISRIGTFADGDYIRLHYTFRSGAGADDGVVVGNFKVSGTQLQKIGAMQTFLPPAGTSFVSPTVVETDRLDGVEDNQYANPAMLYWYEVKTIPNGKDYGPARAMFRQLYGISSNASTKPLSVSTGTASANWPIFIDDPPNVNVYGDFSTGAFWRGAAGDLQFMALWAQQDAGGNPTLSVNTLALQRGGPIAYYPLDENTGTSIGNVTGSECNATGCNATLVSGGWTSGHTGSAVLGAFRSNGPITSTAVTVSAWVRRDGAGSGYPRILSWNVDGLELADVAAGNNLGVYTPSTGWSATGTNFGSGWHHVAVTVGGGNVVVYYNGAQVFTQPGSISLTGQMSMGTRYNDTESWNGAIDQVRVYDHVLTAAEVLALSQE